MKIRKSDVYQVVEWIEDWFALNGENCKAVIGISGGKDSTVAAKLCVEALGADRVIGVLMPNGVQSDINIARKVIEYLNIESYEINIEEPVEDIEYLILKSMGADTITDQMRFNLPARIRMSTLYAVAQNLECSGRVVNTCNFSEDWIGYSTKYGDAAGDFAPLQDFTVNEVIQIGEILGIPEEFTRKPPSDGLCGKTDEDNLGFTYEQLDRYIELGHLNDDECKVECKIDLLHNNNVFKMRPMDHYKREFNGRAFGFSSASGGSLVENCYFKE